MTLGVYSGWDLLNPWSGSSPSAITYAAPKACVDASNQDVVLVVMFGFSITGTAPVPTPTISYGNCTGTATVVADVWNGFLTNSVYLFMGWVPLAGYDGVSQDINISGLGSVNLDSLLLSAEGGAFGLVLYNVDPTLNATPWTTLQIMPDSPGQNPSDPPQILDFATANGDLILGLGMNDTTGGSVLSVSPSNAVDSVQQLPGTNPGDHNIGAFIATRAVCTADITHLSFSNGPSSPYQGLRCIFGGFVVTEIPAPADCDDFYDETILSLHMDGADAGTTFNDSSQYALTSSGSPFGATHLNTAFNGQTSTAEVLYGTASFTGLSGGGGLRVINNNAITQLEARYDITGDFTIEAALWKASVDVSENSCLIGFTGFTPDENHVYCELYVTISTGTVAAILREQDGSTTVISLTGTTNVCDGQWHTAAIQRSGNTFDLFVDGVIEDTGTSSGVVGITYGQICVGMLAPGVLNTDIGRDIWIDEVRYTGAARYTGAYTPATAAFPDSQCSTPPPPSDAVFVYGKFVPSSDYKAIEMDRLGTIKPRIYAPVPNRTVRSKP